MATRETDRRRACDGPRHPLVAFGLVICVVAGADLAARRFVGSRYDGFDVLVPLLVTEAVALIVGAHALLIAIATRRAALATWLLGLWALLAHFTLSGLFTLVSSTT